MQYHYIVDYEVTALIFLIIIIIRYYNLRRFPDRLTKLFSFILWTALFDLSLDIVGSYTILNAAFLPPWINYVLNTIFYCVQMTFVILMIIYVIWASGKKIRDSLYFILLLIPEAVSFLLIFTNPFTKWIFYLNDIDGYLIYTRGSLFNVLYIITAFYFVVCVVLVYVLRSELQRSVSITTLLFVFINVLATIFQILFPNMLLSGVGIVAAILMMFFILENPETMIDPITNVFNYNALIGFLNKEISSNHKFYLVALDVQGIRRINNSFGIWAGNEAMEKVGLFLTSIENKNIIAFQQIGTRFIFLTKTEASYTNVIHVLQERFKYHWDISVGTTHLHGTIRHFENERFFERPQDVINLIDMTFSSLSNEDFGSVERIDGNILKKSIRYEKIEEALRWSLKNDPSCFSLRYQPIYNIQKNKFTSCEVLLRFKTDSLGEVFPDEFIPIAEKTGFISRIDHMVLERSCDFIKSHPELLKRGVNTFEINLSAANFFTNIFDDVNNTVKKYGINPSSLCFEVTETAATSHPENLLLFMNNMKKQGYRFALDDFGTGYANLAQVAEFPFDIIKIDKTLLNAKRPKEKIIFADILVMFDKMNLYTVTEGIETEEQANKVIALNCNYIQGFHYSKPLYGDDFIEFIQNNN